MLNSNDLTDAQSDRAIVITRIFNAPRELVFKAWTEPTQVAQWWGPRGFTTKVTQLDLRPGGHWHYVMIAPNGKEYPAKGVFREVVPFERIVTTDEFDEGFDKVIKADLPQGVMLTALFEDLGSKTKLTLHILHESIEDRRKHEEMGVIPGWNSSFDCLDEFLATAIAASDNLTM
jgi:uncharacterized protein YndB with AHSA1/START domain